jgi:hypothetical protein
VGSGGMLIHSKQYVEEHGGNGEVGLTENRWIFLQSDLLTKSFRYYSIE